MDQFFKGLFDKVPDIIGAVRSPLGLASLIVLVLGLVGAFLFRNVPGILKLPAFAMITVGLLGLFIVASNSTRPDEKAAADAKADTCAHYATTAFADYKLMMKTPKCQDFITNYLHPFRWQSSYENYLLWCHLFPSGAAKYQSEMRDAHLHDCGAR
jgi:hypothetical protein